MSSSKNFAVKFRGEFGILSDDTSVSLYENESHNLLDIHSKSRENSTLGIQDLFAIPYEDIRHLRALFPGGKKNKDTGILSARLFSLKLDLKDA